jgi:hypothetical protein
MRGGNQRFKGMLSSAAGTDERAVFLTTYWLTDLGLRQRIKVSPLSSF